jgi:glycyl-tRNA synthetase
MDGVVLPSRRGAKWYEFWKAERMKWWQSLGVKESKLRREHEKDELSHYSKMTVDTNISILSPRRILASWKELPIAAASISRSTSALRTETRLLDRTSSQAQRAGQALRDQGQKSLPPHRHRACERADARRAGHPCEPTAAHRPAGHRRDAAIKPQFAPIKAGIFLVNKEGMPEVAEKLYMDLRQPPVNTIPSRRSANVTPGRNRHARFTIDGDSSRTRPSPSASRDTMSQAALGSIR